MSPRRSDRLWLSAILAWLAMMAAAVIVAARAGWFGNGLSDPEIRSWTDFVFLAVMATSPARPWRCRRWPSLRP